MAESGWGAKFLRRCDVDPDDPADVRAVYESCREAYGRWLATRVGDIDDETYYTLVGAIEDLYGWERTQWPLDWPAPTLVLLTRPLRNLLPRKPTAPA
jgi:hypothetical protein